MPAKQKVVFCWSGGKDSALALNRLRHDDRYEVVSLLTTCNEGFQRVSMHGVRLELLDRQAAEVGLPLQKVFVSQRSSNDEYRERMAAALDGFKAQGVTGCVYGDIFLEDLRQWRDANLARIGMVGVYPLWRVDSRELIREFFALGFGSVVCCANDAWFDARGVGRRIDAEFIASLPAGVDPCGENGEYHSFAFAGPIFRQPITFSVGEKVFRPLEQTHPGAPITPPVSVGEAGRRPTTGFWFCDLVPEGTP
jgi:uncharacterized protein (TIGR00290 family)